MLSLNFNTLNLYFFSVPLFYMKMKILKVSQFLNLEISLSLLNVIFMISLMFIFKNILKFSIIYMSKTLSFYYFKILMWLFCLSMMALLFSENFLTLILSWEFLGITSYFLILYYYNWNSMSGSKLTFISNRIGDIFIMTMFFLFSDIKMYAYLIVMILIMGVTKSSQFPFNSWLPAAMAAPTPVSALVHSSTLVTSGFYLFFKFKMPMYNMIYKKIMLYMGILTMMIGSLSALLSKDIKKIIAFSTLSQLGLLMSSFYSLWLGLMMFHLLSHAFLKSFFFIMFGFSILNMYSQNLNKITSFYKMFFKMTMFYVMFLNFTSFFFTCMFVSKEILVSTIMMKKIFLFLIYFFILIFTLLYMKRLYFIFLLKKFYFSFSFKFTSNFTYMNFKYFFIFNMFSLLWMSNILTYYCYFNYLNLVMLLFLFFILMNFKFMNIYKYLNMINNMFCFILMKAEYIIKEEYFILLMKFKMMIFLKNFFNKLPFLVLMLIFLSL
uniref:NADH:ubiquinone reductase (H(+)-translocating) n=1 Tax=Romanomermis nielseni TaxID=416167 RepID=A1Z398_9BILA|nr:NADH dehydrogenase subunit 5 [Romanomermis nielseni]ABL73781.1 NADH dehydrogenase subunit 5 [Romanomermis nielseni]